MQANRWAAYSVDLVVYDHAGKPLPNAVVRTTDDLEVRTNQDGLARLYYMNGGLHVITVTVGGSETVQTKLTLPLTVAQPVEVRLSPLAGQGSPTSAPSFVDTQ